jgi:hypothetical protein
MTWVQQHLFYLLQFNQVKQNKVEIKNVYCGLLLTSVGQYFALQYLAPYM